MNSYPGGYCNVGRPRGDPKLLRLLDGFWVNDRYYEAYLLAGGKVMLIDEEGGIIFFGDDKEYFNYKRKLTNKTP